MQKITPYLTEVLEKHIDKQSVGKAPPYEIHSYRILLEQIAQLSYLNKNQLLFFRGQTQDYLNKAGVSTFYPSIYRDEILPYREIVSRFDLLDDASRQLKDLFKKNKIKGLAEINQKRYVQWSLLQHYEVCKTPLLDFTHSIRVACSFSQLENSEKKGFIFVFGLPYITNRISYNSEDDIVNIRLLSICPPDALRPYFQEGYLAGTTDITSDYESKPELDFNNRLIAKFAIPNTDTFWGEGLDKVQREMLYPKGDKVQTLCDMIKPTIRTQNKDIGDFVAEWVQLEYSLTEVGRKTGSKLFSLREIVTQLNDMGVLSFEQMKDIEKLRSFRNQVVHQPNFIDKKDILENLELLRRIRSATNL